MKLKKNLLFSALLSVLILTTPNISKASKNSVETLDKPVAESFEVSSDELSSSNDESSYSISEKDKELLEKSKNLSKESDEVVGKLIQKSKELNQESNLILDELNKLKEESSDSTSKTDEKEEDKDLDKKEEPKEEKPEDSYTPAKVQRVIDGDTLELLIEGKVDRLRLIGVDTPESVHPDKSRNEEFGKVASNYTREKLLNKDIRVEFDVQQRDRYKRLLGYVWLGDKMYNEEVTKAGYAKVATFPPNVKYLERFLAAEAYAKENKLGMWSQKPFEKEEDKKDTEKDNEDSSNSSSDLDDILNETKKLIDELNKNSEDLDEIGNDDKKSESEEKPKPEKKPEPSKPEEKPSKKPVNHGDYSKTNKWSNFDKMNLIEGTYFIGEENPYGWEVLGNGNSYKKKEGKFIYHMPGGTYYPEKNKEGFNKNDRIWFISEDAAQKANFRRSLR